MSTHIQIPDETVEKLVRWYPRALLTENSPLVKGSLVGRLFGRWGQAAVTINKTVHLTPNAADLTSLNGAVLIAHELYHVQQQQEMGWLPFFLRYAVGWRPSQRKDGRSHSLEAPAYARGDEVREALSAG